MRTLGDVYRNAPLATKQEETKPQPQPHQELPAENVLVNDVFDESVVIE